jgi:hypothetical protein
MLGIGLYVVYKPCYRVFLLVANCLACCGLDVLMAYW